MGLRSRLATSTPKHNLSYISRHAMTLPNSTYLIKIPILSYLNLHSVGDFVFFFFK